MRSSISIFAVAAMVAALASAEESKTFASRKSTDGKCRALALSGGANYGSWEVGVMWGLVNYGNPDDFAWDVISGVSAGAINTAATAVFETGDEINMTQFLSDAWANLHTHDIWQEWPDAGPIVAIFEKPSMLDSSPAIDFMTNLLAPFGEFKRRFTLAAVDV